MHVVQMLSPHRAEGSYRVLIRVEPRERADVERMLALLGVRAGFSGVGLRLVKVGCAPPDLIRQNRAAAGQGVYSVRMEAEFPAAEELGAHVRYYELAVCRD